MSAYDMANNWGHFHWPIILAAHTAIALGTYFGGWRIVHTMGSRITKLKPVGGFCAETGGAITLTGDPRRWPVEPGMPGVVRMFDPYTYRCPAGHT